MQSSKGGGLISTFGGSSVSTMFGARRTSDFLSKSTIVLAVIFLASSLILNIIISKQKSSIDEGLIQGSGGVTNERYMPGQQPTGTEQNNPGTNQSQPTDGGQNNPEGNTQPNTNQ